MESMTIKVTARAMSCQARLEQSTITTTTATAKAMSLSLEEVVDETLRLLPPTIPRFKDIKAFSPEHIIFKSRHEANGMKAIRVNK
jgi:hypothetical protein